MWFSALYLVFYVATITHAAYLQGQFNYFPFASVCLKEDCPSHMKSLPRSTCDCPDGYRCCKGKCPYLFSTYAECHEEAGSVVAATDLPPGVLCCKPSDIPCLVSGGTCQPDIITCPGGYESGKCSGLESRKCCKPDNTACINLGGRCQVDISPCPGFYASAKCHDQLPMKCCNPGPADDFKCTSQGGVCQDVSSTTCHGGEGHFVPGICGGGDSRRCCLDPCSAVRVISRYSWSDTSTPTSTTNLTTPANIVFIQHTAGKKCYNTPDCIANIKSISTDMTEQTAIDGSSDMGYNFLIGEDGNIYEVQGWNTQGAHTEGSNDSSIRISFMGDFTNQTPNMKAMDAAKAMIDCSVSRGLVSKSHTLAVSPDIHIHFNGADHDHSA